MNEKKIMCGGGGNGSAEQEVCSADGILNAAMYYSLASAWKLCKLFDCRHAHKELPKILSPIASQNPLDANFFRFLFVFFIFTFARFSFSFHFTSYTVSTTSDGHLYLIESTLPH